MELVVTLEKKIKQFDDEMLYRELESKVQFAVLRARKQLPSLSELLYNKADDEMESLKELLGLDT